MISFVDSERFFFSATASDTIRWFKQNDVAVKVISGDNPVTVSEVARRAGIVNASQFISLSAVFSNKI